MKEQNQFLMVFRVFALSVLMLLVSYGQASAQEPWPQIGADIDGDAAEDWAGNSVSLSADGAVVAVGAPGYDGSVFGSDVGLVRVFAYQGVAWVQVGDDIEGAAGDWAGYSVSLSADGTTVAVGAPSNAGGHVQVYENQGGTWVQVGADINGEAADDNFGYSVSLSADGSLVAIGAPFNDAVGDTSGHARVYQNVTGTWTQIGTDIDGTAAGDELGTSVSLSADGSIVAVGAPGASAGQVQVYRNVSGTWTQIGADIDGEVTNDFFGYAVSLNALGTRVAVGAYGNSGGGSGSGHTRVYENQSGTWTQIGADIDGESVSDQSGTSVSLNADGSVVAIGAPANDGNGSNSGHVRVYEDVAGTWTKIVEDIDGEASQDQLGYFVSLNASGKSVAIGAPYNDANGSEAGHTRVFGFLPADLALLKSADPALVVSGEAITYTLTFSNTGLGVASDVAITDSIPVSVTNTSVISSGNELSPMLVITQQLGSSYVWDVADLAPGEGGTIIITGVLSDGLPIGAFNNTATISTSADEVDLVNNVSSVSVTRQNFAPVAVNDSDSTDEDIPLTVAAPGVLDNDNDVDGDAFIAVLDDDSLVNGTLDLNDDGSFVYTPTLNANGTFTFSYHATDGALDSDLATATITVNSVNDVPTAADDSVSVAEDSQDNAIDVLANDSFAPDFGETLSVFAVGDAANGTAVDNDSNVLYTPDASFSGADVFTYTISDGNGGFDTASVNVTVSNVNNPPTANDDNASVAEDSQDNAIDVLVNDSFAPDLGETLSVFAVGDAANGTAVDNDTEVLYTPNADFAGTDVFTYTISDGNDGFATASITVTVTNLNDAPLFGSTPVTVATAAVTYTYAIATTDVDLSDTRAISATLLPAWLTFGDNGDGTALLSGMPAVAAVGEHPVTLVVTDTAGLSATQSFTISVSAEVAFNFTYLPVITK